MRRVFAIAVCAGLAFALGACDPDPTGTTVGPIHFEDPQYTTGTIDGQDGWQSDGAAGSGCAVYDHEVDDVAASGTEPSDFGFGDQALRMSSAVTAGCFSDQTFSKPTGDFAGETGAVGDGKTTGSQRGYFESNWSFATAGNPLAAQDGLHVVASPDRGDGARMSWVEMQDCSTDVPVGADECQSGNDGLEVNFVDVNNANVGDPGANEDFIFHNVASGLDRGEAHSITLQMWFFEGADNDVVKVCVDGTTCQVGGSWENYYRNDEENPTRPVDSILFRTAGDANPGSAGNGFFIDNFESKAQNYDHTSVAISGPAAVTEGNAGTTTATYPVMLSKKLPFAVTVPYTITGDTASGTSDYTATNGSLTFAPGDTVKNISVDINGDTTDENLDETFKVALGAPSTVGRNPGAASDTYVFRHVFSKKTTIKDDDSTVRISDANVDEPDSGTAPISFSVTLDNPSAVPVSVTLDTANGSAVAPGDYTAKSNFLVTFAPGQTTRIVKVGVKADNLVEGNENFLANLSAPSNATIADGVGAGVINDADD